MSRKFKAMRLFALTLALAFFTSLSAIAIAPNVVHVQANDNCYFGGTENLSDAQHGNFGTVYIQRGHAYDWRLSHNSAILYYASIRATGGPMPSHLPMKGSVRGGASLGCP